MNNNKYKTTGSTSALAKRLTVTLIALLLYLALSYIPTPFIRQHILTRAADFELWDAVGLFNGGSLQKVTLMATGVSSYISASIVVQLLMYSNRNLLTASRLPGGQRVIKNLTLRIGMIISFILSAFSIGTLESKYDILILQPIIGIILIAIFHTLGTYIAVQIGFWIEEKGIGNGVSLLIALNVIIQIPQTVRTVGLLKSENYINNFQIGLLLLIIAIMIIGLVMIESSEQRLDVVYAKSVARGRTHLDRGVQNLSFKINGNGVMPIIIASIVMTFVNTILLFVVEYLNIPMAMKYFGPNTIGQMAILVIIIFATSRFYGFLTFDAEDINNRLQQQTGIVIGVESGNETKKYLSDMNDGLVRLSSVVLSALAVLPFLINQYFGLNLLSATSLLIVIGVVLNFIDIITNEMKIIKIANSTK